MKNKAFTLIELLVVVAIIGILAAVGVTTFNGFQEKAKVSATKANHKTIVKFMTSEIMKCSLGDSNLSLLSSSGNTTSVSCNPSSVNTITLGSRFVDHFRGAGFTNPFNIKDQNGTVYATSGNSPWKGQTRIVNAGGTKIQIVTKYSGSDGQWAGNTNEVLIDEINDDR